jgi:RNA polymerase sigma-70 factor (ECF subfamily)
VPDAEESSQEPQHSAFVTTHWSVVSAAGQADSSLARAAMEKLCGAYWYPLYVFARRQGAKPHDAEDLVQSFFAQLIEKKLVAAADQAKGRFRSFLLIALKRFMANEWHKSRAQKRGGVHAPVALDALTAEERYAIEPADRLTAEQLFERRWALTLLDRVLQRLRDEQAQAGREKQFAALKETLTAHRGGTAYAQLGEQLRMSEGAVKVAVHRLRQRYRELLEAEIADTVSSPEEVDAERHYLLEVLGR